MISKSAWKNRLSAWAWDFLSNPFTIGIYLGFATFSAFVGSAGSGIPAYILMALGFLLVIFVDPPRRIGKWHARRNRPPQARPLPPAAGRKDDRKERIRELR